MLLRNEKFLGERGKTCALVVSNLIGAWKNCIDVLAGKSASARGTTINLLDQKGLDAFGVGEGDKETATKCASSASGIISKIFGDDMLARLLANYARGNDATEAAAANRAEDAAAIGAFNEAYRSLTSLLQKETGAAAVSPSS